MTITVQKNASNRMFLQFSLLMLLWSGTSVGAEIEQGHEEEGKEVKISEDQQKMAGIVVMPLLHRSLAGEIAAPGEVKPNAYLSSKVTPRITAQVMQRLVHLGEQVEQGQPLITLSSIDMAEAQGELQVADREWQRIRQLGRETVSAGRYLEARVNSEQARARVAAYGMTPNQIEALLADDGSAHADGAFELVASRRGTVVRDDFVEGEFVEAGRVLFEISDETQIWVEASLTPDDASLISPGTTARVRVGNGDWLSGQVVHSYHILNEVTRTRAVRINIANPDEQLHPGLFVDTRIQGDETIDVLAVPEEAVLRSPDGDWVVFVEDEPGYFAAMEIELVRTVKGLAVIEGIDSGTRVVIKGAFFVQSEFAKGGFDIHAH